MNLVKVGLIGLIGYFLYDKWRTVAVGTSLNANIKGFTFGSNTGILKLGLQNPQSSGFTINAISGTIYLGDDQIANVSMFQPITLQPLAETIVPLTIQVGILDVLLNLKNVVNGSLNLHTPIRLVASINVDGILVPLDLKYNEQG